jgi:hypothetical protein
VLLAVVAVAIAWASCQSARWHGKQALAQGTSLAARVKSTRASNFANREARVDIAIFTQWINGYAAGNPKLAAVYGDRFRPEFRRAVDAWVATKPRENPHAPPTPFAMPQYQLAASAQADRLESRSEAFAQAVRRDLSARITTCLPSCCSRRRCFLPASAAGFIPNALERRSSGLATSCSWER